jgi:hypothetical protein
MTLHTPTVCNVFGRPHLHVRLFTATAWRWRLAAARLSYIINAYKTSIMKTQRKTQPMIYVHTWNDNVKMDLTEIRCEEVGVLVNTANHLQVPHKAGHILSSQMTVTLWRTLVYGNDNRCGCNWAWCTIIHYTGVFLEGNKKSSVGVGDPAGFRSGFMLNRKQ